MLIVMLSVIMLSVVVLSAIKLNIGGQLLSY
jgi:hypothetical protein